MSERLFDERFKDAAASIYGYAPMRLALCAIVATFVGLGLGIPAAATWAGAALLAEAAMLAATRHIIRTNHPSGRAAWACCASYLATSVWSVAGILLWSSNSPAFQVAAAAFFGGHLLYIQAHHARSLGAALPALPSVILPGVVPLAFPHFEGVHQLVVIFTLAAASLHALTSIWVSLTEARRLLETKASLQAASQAKSEFLARMSHEIRTPLNGVLGMTHALAAEPDLQPAHRQSLAVIRQSGEGLLAVLNDVLDLSKVEAGQIELEEIPFDLEATVRGAQETFAAQAAAKGLGFRLALEPEASGTYLGDPTRLRQVLYNLLSNALKFTEAGEVSLSVRRTGDWLELVVADSGIGIAPEGRERLFSRFHQLEPSTTRRYGGTGLGLSICRELVLLMRGSITVDSRLGAGSEFTVVLPLPRLGDASMAGSVGAENVGAALGPLAPRVLAAEDNPVNQLVLKTLLAQVGIEPEVVGDGQAAVEAWAAGRYDVILMDVQMPLMDGVTAARAIREAEAAQGRVRTPIVALTANAMQHQVGEYLAAGFDHHVAKPIDPARLYEALALAVEGSDSVAATAAS